MKNSIHRPAAITALLLAAALHTTAALAQTYPGNEDGPYEDMLTPAYYTQPDTSTFRASVNEFIHVARLTPYRHPLEDSTGQRPAFTIGKDFGDGTGPGGTAAHHPATDMHLDGATLVNLYAAHDGLVHTGRDITRYRQYLTITSDITGSTGMVIGKMVTLYGHVDLDLDTAAGLDMDGHYVHMGDRVSAHLYAGTVGGPHLHYEIRYYRATDTGIEDFYGGLTADKTALSAGSWLYGYWNPDAGYGFGNPMNHMNWIPAGMQPPSGTGNNPPALHMTGDALLVRLPGSVKYDRLAILDMAGHAIYRHTVSPQDTDITISTGNFGKGIYMLHLSGAGYRITEKIILH